LEQIRLHPEDGSSKALRNVGILPHNYTASQLRTQKLEFSIAIFVKNIHPSIHRLISYIYNNEN